MKFAFAIFALFIGSLLGFSQGFVNLDFEAANVSGYSEGSQNVLTTDAFPGWGAFYYFGSTTNIASQVGYGVIPLNGSQISVLDSSSQNAPFFLPLQGQFSAILAGGNSSYAGISQTGLVPNGTVSLQMDIRSFLNTFIVSVDETAISMIPLSTSGNFTIYGGDISAFAGQVVTLNLISPSVANPNTVNINEFDSIIFSSSPVPEPSGIALGALGALLLGFRRWRKSSR